MKVQAKIVFSGFVVTLLIVIQAVFAEPASVKKNAEDPTQNVIKRDTTKKGLVTVSKLEGESVDEAEALFERGFDKKAKTADVLELVEKATAYFEKHSLADSCHAFTHTKQFLLGDLYVFVLDTKGTIIAYGTKEQFIWRSVYDAVDRFGFRYTKKMIETAQAGGGWVVHEYRDSIRSVYVKELTKDGKKYILGSGFFTHSKSDTCVELVKGAVSYFNEGIAQGQPPSDLFSSFSYPLSQRFVVGDLYLISSSFDGEVMAQGDRPGLIGTNTLDYQDSAGLYVNKETIKKLENVAFGEGVWVEYISKNAPKQIYAEKVVDKKGKKYFIACGYYPDATREKVVDLVERGYKYMKSNGVTSAADKFSDKQSDDFRYGDLYLFVYDLKGKCIAHGGNEDYVGKNHMSLQDSDGNYFIKDLISTAHEYPKSRNSWSNHRFKNAFQAIYVELIDMGTESYIIGCGFYPLSKKETMVLLAKSAVRSFAEMGEALFAKVTDIQGSFVRGDLSVFILDSDGICYAWGDQLKMVWTDLSGLKDEEGKTFIASAIEMSQHGGTKLIYTINKRKAVMYAEAIEKNGKTYIIGSSFYA